MAHTRIGSWTWFAAMPAPPASRIVSTRSSMKRCRCALASSSPVTSRAVSRRTGCPITAILRSATSLSPLFGQDDRSRRNVTEEYPRRCGASADLTNLEAVLMKHFAELVETVDPHRLFDSSGPPSVQHHRAFHPHSAGDEV